jgi:hypothetical protein
MSRLARNRLWVKLVNNPYIRLWITFQQKSAAAKAMTIRLRISYGSVKRGILKERVAPPHSESLPIDGAAPTAVSRD